jgi:hypothetical protein
MTRAEPPDDGSRHRRDGQDRDQACRKLVPADQVLDAAFALRLWLFPTALLGGTPVPLPAFDDALALCGTPVPAFLVAVAQRLPLESRGALRVRLFGSPAACIPVARISRFHKGPSRYKPRS